MKRKAPKSVQADATSAVPTPAPVSAPEAAPAPKAKAKPKAEKVVEKAEKVVEKAAKSSDTTFHGVEVVGVVKKGGTARVPLAALLTLDQISVMKGFNPRTDVGDIESLAKSIKVDGLLSSLVVRPSQKEGKFDLIAGERRYRALQAIGWEQPIPVLIRSDLLGDDQRALAVAVAENSEDGRSNLNPIEIGRVVQKLRDEFGWEPLRIARECGMHTQKVRRALALMTTPAAIREKIATGDVSANAGLEIARLEKKAQDEVAKVILEEGGASSASDIKRIRKQIATQQSAEEVAIEGPKTTKRGAPVKRVPTAWRGSREKQAALQFMCAAIASMERDENDAGFIEHRAQIVALLWDRGDLDALDIPDESNKKASKVLWSIIHAEAAKVPQAEDEDKEADDPFDGDAEE